MDERFAQLPWAELWHTQGEIPWSVLEAFADGVAAEPDLATELFATYERAREVSLDKTCYADLYVPAIFALAAPKLDEDQRCRIGEFLVKKLAEAGSDDDSLMMEVLMAAGGSMGPVIVPAALDAIAAEPDANGAWFHLWSLTALAASTQETAIRDRTAQACVELLERADRREADPGDGIEAAHTLGLLGRAEYLELLKRLSKKCEAFSGHGDYEEAIVRLRDPAARDDWPPAWEDPVGEWLEPVWRLARDWFARRDAEAMEELNADPTEPRSLIRRFLKSAWATNLPADLFEETGYITNRLLEYARTYEGATPNALDERVLRGVLLDVFPRRVAEERDFFAMVAPVVEAFLGWMGAEGMLENASALAQAVQGWSEDIVTASMDPRNWGPGKRMTMNARQAGVDTTDAESLQRFWYEQALQSLDSVEQEPDDQAEQLPLTPTAPIVEHAPKIGRNEPCPCGSGRKYKKCCGSQTKGQAATI